MMPNRKNPKLIRVHTDTLNRLYSVCKYGTNNDKLNCLLDSYEELQKQTTSKPHECRKTGVKYY